jgi:hypothetical protein
MKHHQHGYDNSNQTTKMPPRAAATTLTEAGTSFAPSADEVARRAYFSYVDQGCPEGRAVQHWLEAEADMIKERQITRTHAGPNKT